jgi:hypothetical protein
MAEKRRFHKEPPNGGSWPKAGQPRPLRRWRISRAAATMALSCHGTKRMKAIACSVAAVVMLSAHAWAAGGASAVAPAPGAVAGHGRVPQQEPAAASGLTCYMPYAASRDHLVTGCEVPGYRMQFDLAKSWGMFMVLLPDGASVETARVYFALDTPDLRGQPVTRLFENDLKGLQANRPGTRVLKRLTHTLPLPGAAKGHGQCAGVSVAYPAQNSHFPFETYFICDGGSKRYALMLSLSAMSQQEMDAAMPAFLKWMDVPQTVRDVEVRPAP